VDLQEEPTRTRRLWPAGAALVASVVGLALTAPHRSPDAAPARVPSPAPSPAVAAR
jgi:hypothetical protein